MNIRSIFTKIKTDQSNSIKLSFTAWPRAVLMSRVMSRATKHPGPIDARTTLDTCSKMNKWY